MNFAMGLQHEHGTRPPSGVSWSDLLQRLRDGSPSVQELMNVHRALDRECLRRSQVTSAEPGDLVQITLCLSRQLLLWSDPDSGRYQETQLRALIAALALLHHNGLTKLTAKPYDELRINIADRFVDIVDGRRNSQMSLEDRRWKANALYLVRLVDQYFSLIKRAQPLPEAIAIPLLGLVLDGACIATGQYNSLWSAFQNVNRILGLIPGRQSRHLHLPAIQELTRNATTSLAECDNKSQNDNVSREVEKAADIIKLVFELLHVSFQEIPSRKSDAWNWPFARLRRGPPLLNKWYFFYGLLDCAAQLARHLRPGQLPAPFLRRLERLMEETEFEEFRWKVTEILDAHNPNGVAIHQWPKSLHNDHNGEKPRVLLDFMEGDLRGWQQSGETQVHQLLPSQGLFQKGYAHAGLSPDCSLAFFNNSTAICVYRVDALSQGRRHHKPNFFFSRKYDRISQIADVSLTNTMLAVSTRSYLELYRIESHSHNARPTKMIPHGEWDPSGVAIHDHGLDIMVAAAYRRGRPEYREGCIVLYQIELAKESALQIKIIQRHVLPMQDVPKSINFDDRGSYLVCITEVANSIQVWGIKDGAPMDERPVTINNYHHKPETDCDGLTSAVTYTSPKEQDYLLCTSSASTERFRTGGEWPFSSPITPVLDHAPSSSVQDFIALKDHRQLVAGAVSNAANTFAVLEKSGKILILQLTGHEDGGICSRNEAPRILRDSLCELRSTRATASCLRFDASGERLYAVDPEGKLLVVAFTPGD